MLTDLHRPQAAGLPKYISAIQRVGRALNEMEATNLRSNQEAISEYSGLLQTGSRQLEDIFRSMLEEEAKFPIEPMTYVTKSQPIITLSVLRRIHELTYTRQTFPDAG